MEEKTEHKIMLSIPVELWQRIELARTLTMAEARRTTLQKKDFLLDMIMQGLEKNGK